MYGKIDYVDYTDADDYIDYADYTDAKKQKKEDFIRIASFFCFIRDDCHDQ